MSLKTQNVFDSTSKDLINHWIHEATSGHINEILNDFDPKDTVLIIASVVHFTAYWQTQFSKAQTHVKRFHLLDGTTKSHPMMYRTDALLYYHTDTFEAVSLPYSAPNATNDIRMNIFLPAVNSSLVEFQQNFSQMLPGNWNSIFRLQHGTVGLPRFKIETRIELIDTLQSLGIKSAFDRKSANFSKIRGGEHYPLFISQFLHQSFIDVDEEGTEATAATLIEMQEDWGEGEYIRGFEMIVDRPFFFVIQDNTSGIVLFMGQIVEPI
ncbi:MAG: serpin family protein [Chloroflexota bacterium]